MFCREGCWGGAVLTSKLGTFVRACVAGAESGMPKEIMSTIPETSFLTTSGRLDGRVFP